jgi:hypothetical protein
MDPADFVHEIAIHADRAKVHAFLCDLRNYVSLHPLIESIEELSPTEEMPASRRYRVVDRIPFGPFRLRTMYTAALEANSEYQVHGHAWQSPGIRLRTVYVLEDVTSGTHLIERVSIAAPRILRRVVFSQARRSHEETLQKMKAFLEGRG